MPDIRQNVYEKNTRLIIPCDCKKRKVGGKEIELKTKETLWNSETIMYILIKAQKV